MFDPALAKELLQNLPLNRHLGVEVLAVSAAAGSCLLPDREELKNHVGTQHAGALFTVGEAASGACVLGALGEHVATVTPLAKNATIAYKKPARGPIVGAASLKEPIASVLDRLAAEGKTSFGVHVVLTDTAGLVVAEMDVEWHLRKS